MDVGALRDIERDLRRQCRALDPDSVALADVLAVFRCLESMAKLAEGAKLRMARKVEEAGCHRASGARDAAEYLAKSTGTSVTAAKETLATSKRLQDQAATDEALANGQVSVDQANAVSDAAAVDPAAEAALLAKAQHETLRRLRDHCATTKANKRDDKQQRDAIHKARSLRTWRDKEGAWHLHLQHLPEVGAEIEALLAPHTHARFDAARRAGAHDERVAYAADGFLDLARASTAANGETPKGARRADTKLFVHIDADTLTRGRTEAGSICHIDGLGPVDVDWVRSTYSHAFVVALIEDGQDVKRVVHLGRQVTAHQRSALEARGYCCEIPGCDITWGLEIDHDKEWSWSRVTTLDDLSWKCHHDHDLHTHHGHKLTGPPGQRTWTRPDGTVVSRDPTPDRAPDDPPSRSP